MKENNSSSRAKFFFLLKIQEQDQSIQNNESYDETEKNPTLFHVFHTKKGG